MKRSKQKEDVEEYLKEKKYKADLIEIFKTGIALLGIVILAISAILVIVYKFQNPKLTDTEIAIYSFKKYWWSYLWGIIGCFYFSTN